MMEEMGSTSLQAGWISKIKIWIMEYKRVLIVTKKPTKEEFLVVVKIASLGILAVGLIGFVIQMIKILLFQ